jgi:FO synthase
MARVGNVLNGRSKEITYYWSYPLVLSSLARENGNRWAAERVGSYVLLPRKRVVHELREATKLGAHVVDLTGGSDLALEPDVVRTLRYYGLQDYLDYIRMVCDCIVNNNQSALLLPEWHLGALSFAEMKLLRYCIVSWKTSLWSEGCKTGNGGAGETWQQKLNGSFEQRLRSLAYAGKAKIPTNVDVHFGEESAPSEVRQILSVVGALHKRYGHIQCVGLVAHESNNGRDDPRTNGRIAMLLRTARVAREILPDEVRLQVAGSGEIALVESLIEEGVSDIGGLSVEEGQRRVNGSFLAALAARLDSRGVRLRERLPIFEPYIARGWLPEAFREFLMNAAREKRVLSQSS